MFKRSPWYFCYFLDISVVVLEFSLIEITILQSSESGKDLFDFALTCRIECSHHTSWLASVWFCLCVSCPSEWLTDKKFPRGKSHASSSTLLRLSSQYRAIRIRSQVYDTARPEPFNLVSVALQSAMMDRTWTSVLWGEAPRPCSELLALLPPGSDQAHELVYSSGH